MTIDQIKEKAFAKMLFNFRMAMDTDNSESYAVYIKMSYDVTKSLFTLDIMSVGEAYDLMDASRNQATAEYIKFKSAMDSLKSVLNDQ